MVPLSALYRHSLRRRKFLTVDGSSAVHWMMPVVSPLARRL